jgi:UDP-2-acetamido-3-amino-2,3-dideoxy-glucuronate N-acetyltransferase
MSNSTTTGHPTASVSGEADVGTSTSIWNQAQVRENVRIGDDCIVGKDLYIDFGAEIGDSVQIQDGTPSHDGATIESGAFIGPRAINLLRTLKANDDWELPTVWTCYGALIGAGVVLLANVAIGWFSLVAVAAVVTHDVPDHASGYGQPCPPGRLSVKACYQADRREMEPVPLVRRAMVCMLSK